MTSRIVVLSLWILVSGLADAADVTAKPPACPVPTKYPNVFFKPWRKKPAYPLPYSELCRSLEWKGVAVSEPDRSVFCCCPVEGPRGKIHMFAARGKPGANVWKTWGRSSAIAHYVADKPEGPFRYVATVLEGTRDGSWDSYGPQNPDVRKIDGKYVMIYTGTRDLETYSACMSIGMAIADEPAGPWRRVGQIFDYRGHSNPVIATGGVCNATVVARSNGKYYIYFKAGAQHAASRFFVAIADKLEGPYTVHPKPVTEDAGYYIEDGFAWEQDGVVYLMTTDCQQVPGIHGVAKPNILWRSRDGLHFKYAEATSAACNIITHYKDYKPDRNNRHGEGGFADPAFLLQNGKPTYYYAPSSTNINGGKNTVIYCMKVHFQDPSKVAVETPPAACEKKQ